MKVIIAIIVLLGILAAPYKILIAGNNVDASAKPTEAKTWEREKKADEKYAAYSMDGVTSASKLAAQRSHTVAGEDERNFAVFTGIVAILIVIFVTQIILSKK